jgi:hypothetical protein
MTLVLNQLGIKPGSRVVGTRWINDHLLLRAKLPSGKTLRYLACTYPNGDFKYFRLITSSERKRVGRGILDASPLETINWARRGQGWQAEHSNLVITTLAPNYLIAPTDYTLYSVNGELTTHANLEEMIHEDHNHG